MSTEEENPAGEAPDTDQTVESTLKGFDASDEAIEKIKTYGVESVGDLTEVTHEEFVAAGLTPVAARKLIKSLAPTPVAATDAAAFGTGMSFDALLPSVPDDGSWLTALKTGGVLKVDQSTIISAIRAALAWSVGLYDVPAKLIKAMEEFADNNDEQVPVEFFKLRQQLSRRSYAEVFEAIPGLDGNFVTDGRKKQLFGRIDEHLWPAIEGFNAQLRGWQETWNQQGANPAMIMAALGSLGGGAPLPGGMVQPPSTDALRDEADALADAVNRVFRGTGVQIAAALAYEATEIRKTLEDPRLPGMIGANNRDQMLKQLGVGVSSTYPRLETSLIRFVLGIIQANDIPAGNDELQYFSALYALGNQIKWNELNGYSHSLTTIGGGRR